MRSNKKNILFVFLGIFIGLLFGGIFGWWIKPVEIIQNIITPVKNFSFLSNLSDTNDSVSLKKEIQYPASGYVDYNRRSTNSSSVNDSSFETENIDHVADSTYDATIDNATENKITVKKDELLFVKEIDLIVKTSAQEKLLDSLLIDEEQPKTPKKTMRIEFWRSPINYHGYSFANNKLTIFGIYDVEETVLVKLNNVMYLKNNIDYYQLDQTAEFKPLRKINNSTLLKQLVIK